MDIKVTKGLASVGNEELRDWTEKGWNQAMREGNYDRSREHLNFEIRPGGMVAPIDKSRPLIRRMAENLASRGIKDPNEGLAEPRFRTVVNFIFGGSTERMRELAFGNQKVDFESKGGNDHIRRMPEIEKWAQDIFRFVADKYGEENIVSFIVHCDEKNPHVHCALLPIDKDKRFAFKKIFHGQNRIDYKNYLLALHDELAKKTALCEKVEAANQGEYKTAKDWEKVTQEIIEIQKGTCPIALYCLARSLSFFWKSLSEISATTSSLSWAIMLLFNVCSTSLKSRILS